MSSLSEIYVRRVEGGNVTNETVPRPLLPLGNRHHGAAVRQFASRRTSIRNCTEMTLGRAKFLAVIASLGPVFAGPAFVADVFAQPPMIGDRPMAMRR